MVLNTSRERLLPVALSSSYRETFAASETFLPSMDLDGSSIQRPRRLRSMKTLHILIVEDEPLVAINLEIMVARIVTATVLVEPSVEATKKVLHEALDFAFLDVEVTNGKTFEVAQILERKHVPFAFVSASPQEQLPSDLRSVPFIPKPLRCRPPVC
jgi:CheY-like chemotaxis protein